MPNRGFVLLFCVLLFGSAKTFAQSQPTAEQIYGQGVHAFNSQRYAEAIGHFNRIESLGAQDPRAFFFRGLSQARLSNNAAAQADYATAAKMELTVAGRSYSVPKALERIQGRERTVIEQYRRAAKRDWDAEENVRRQKEFEAQKAENDRLFQTIMESGKSVASANLPVAKPDFEPVLSFGAQATTPFGVSRATGTASGQSQSGSTGPNVFQAELDRVPVIEQPEEPRPRVTRRPDDPSATGIFDSLDHGNDFEEGFDADVLLKGGNATTPRTGGSPLGFLGNLFGGGTGDLGSVPGIIDPSDFDDDDDFIPKFGGSTTGGGFDSSPFDTGERVDDDEFVFGPESSGFGVAPRGETTNTTKDTGRSFGKGFAILFKKSDGATTPAQPDTPPSATALPNRQPPDGLILDDDFEDDFGETDPFDSF